MSARKAAREEPMPARSSVVRATARCRPSMACAERWRPRGHRRARLPRSGPTRRRRAATGLFQILDETRPGRSRARARRCRPRSCARCTPACCAAACSTSACCRCSGRGASASTSAPPGRRRASSPAPTPSGPRTGSFRACARPAPPCTAASRCARYLAQVFGNGNDLGQGRQMPCHSGSRASHHVVMSSCVSSQLPHATGIAMAAKIRGDTDVALGYCGDGGTSEEDFHVALNFAAVYKAPVVFVCQNNQWAISTPLALQTALRDHRHQGRWPTACPSLRVDGNDVFAMYAAIREAVDRARARRRPHLHRGADLPARRPQLVGRSHPLPRRGRARGLAGEGSAGPLPDVAARRSGILAAESRRGRPGRRAGPRDPRGHRRRGGGRPAAAVDADRGRLRRADLAPARAAGRPRTRPRQAGQ